MIAEAFNLGAGDWGVVFGVLALFGGLIATFVYVFVEKICEAKIQRLEGEEKDIVTSLELSAARCDALSALAVLLARHDAYLSGVLRAIIVDTGHSDKFPALAEVNRAYQEELERAAAELNIFSNDAMEREASAQILASQVGSIHSIEKLTAAAQLRKNDRTLLIAIADLKRRLETNGHR